MHNRIAINMIIKNHRHHRRGQVILLTVVIMGVSMLIASTVAGYLLLVQIRQSSDITNSTKAIYAADAGVEWSLYRRFKDGERPAPAFFNETSMTVTETVSTTKSVGKSRNTYRAFQISF